MFLGSEVKERGAVAGVRSFVEGLRGRDWHGIFRTRDDADFRRGGRSEFIEFDYTETGP